MVLNVKKALKLRRVNVKVNFFDESAEFDHSIFTDYEYLLLFLSFKGKCVTEKIVILFLQEKEKTIKTMA